MPQPLIGITVSNAVSPSGAALYQSTVTYSGAVICGGGVPLLLAQEPALVERYAEVCAGVLFAGGDDVRMEAFGKTTHPEAVLMDSRRQAFDLALLAACDRYRDKPVLGICLGVQLMALHNGGDLCQHLPDVLGDDAAQLHRGYNEHAVTIERTDSVLAAPGNAAGAPGLVRSAHHQAVTDPGRLRIVARAGDGVVEAIDDPERPFYLGVQWHPERGGEDELSLDLIARFVAACSPRPRKMRHRSANAPNATSKRPA
jgi:putative glutamine amidotransferase